LLHTSVSCQSNLVLIIQHSSESFNIIQQGVKSLQLTKFNNVLFETQADHPGRKVVSQENVLYISEQQKKTPLMTQLKFSLNFIEL